MTAHPTPSDFEARTNATYEALMWALSRPGLPRGLPSAGQACLVETLLDRECAAYCEDEAIAQIASRSGAALVAPSEADHLFLAQEPTVAMLHSLRQGSDMYPEEGATLIIPASLVRGDGLRLSGPGVDDSIEVAVSGVSAAFWIERARIMRYPMGFEVFLLDSDRVLGIPRSTKVEVS